MFLRCHERGLQVQSAANIYRSSHEDAPGKLIIDAAFWMFCLFGILILGFLSVKTPAIAPAKLKKKL